MIDKIKELIEQIRPQLQMDGGDIEFVELVDTVVRVRLKGACRGCPHSGITIKNGVEAFIKREIPEVTEVQAVV